ncbi:MAG TPA: hypothetical protein VE053_16260 [Allosphingosinicella sp.]|nr:hypothetical protein [Allosphingosinicella sp.]
MIEDLLDAAFGARDPRMPLQEVEQARIAAQIALRFGDGPASPVEQGERVLGRRGQDHMILVGTQVPVTNQLGNSDLVIDGTAQGLVAGPFGEARIVRRRCRQRHDPDVMEPRCEGFEASPPFSSQVVGLIEHEGKRAHSIEGIDHGVQGLASPERIEGLIGGQRQSSGFGKVTGDLTGEWRRVQEQGAEPLHPLLADRDGGGKDEGGTRQPANRLQPENGLSRPRSGHHVQAAIVQMTFDLLQDPGLIIAPGTLETHPILHSGFLRAADAGGKAHSRGRLACARVPAASEKPSQSD